MMSLMRGYASGANTRYDSTAFISGSTARARFAGSMRFVYLHIVWFGLWIGLAVEGYPFGLLTMIVSLEAIFLSTFVMISQNRADAKRQVLADLALHAGHYIPRPESDVRLAVEDFVKAGRRDQAGFQIAPQQGIELRPAPIEISARR